MLIHSDTPQQIADYKQKLYSIHVGGFHGAWLHESKSQGLCLVQLCAKYRLVSITLSPYSSDKTTLPRPSI